MKRPALTSPGGKGPIVWMAGHSVTANLLMLVLLVGGFIGGLQIRQEVFPDFELDRVRVTVPYPGASPEEVERGIVLVIEEAVQGLEGVKEIESTAREGVGTVTVEIIEGEDLQKVARDVENEVGRITSFPGEAEKPQVVVLARRRYVVSLALFGDQSENVLREYAEYIRNELIADPEIIQVSLDSVRNREISVEIPVDTLRAYNLTLDQVATRIRQASVELPGGAVKSPGGDILVRMKERRDFGHEFGKAPILSAPDGTRLRLEEIAVVHDGFEETDRFSTFNGMPAVMIEVYRVGDQTPISVSGAVHRVIEKINAELPSGLQIAVRNDRSKIYRQRLGLLLRNGYIGLALVFVLLAVFLEVRLAFWVSLGIPISFLGSLLLLPSTGVSINMVSMFAFIVTLGIVVDDAIIVGENVYHHRQKGAPWLDAAVKGTREIALPVTFSVLTNMVAFMPMFFVSGIMGKIFKMVPVVVILVFGISLVESLFILPAHLGHQRQKREWWIFEHLSRWQRRFSLAFMRFVEYRYGPFLRLALHWRYITVAISIVVFLITLAYIKSGRMGFVLFPKIESDYALVTATLPYGTAVERTEAVQGQLVAAAKEVIGENGGDQLTDGIFARIDGNTTQVRVFLTPPKVRTISTSRLTDLWRGKVGTLPGLESLVFESDAGGPGRGAVLTVELSHQHMAPLEQASAELAAALAFYPNVKDIDDGFSPGKRQIDFKIRPEARSLGLRAEDVARQIRNAYYGAEALRQQRGRDEVRVMVRLPREERASEYHLKEMILRTPTGGEIPIRDAVTMTPGRAYTDITRRNGKRVVMVTADVRPRSKAGDILAAVTKETLPELEEKYPGLTYSFEGRQADRRESVESLMKGMMMALLVIFAMLAVPLNSYIQPAIIMSAIPFGIVGAVIGHLIMGFSLSLVSMFGLVALTGIVVNDSLVLIDFANRRRRAGMLPTDAILDSGIQRFRPIVLTTLTTFGGLAPMIFESSRQARFLVPMAVSLGFGVLFATLITLILVPSLYMVVEDIRNAFHRPSETTSSTLREIR